MLTRKPSVETLRAVFGDDANKARKIFEMSRAQLCETEAGAARVRACYHAPKTYDLRMHALDALGHTYGLEACEASTGQHVDFLNTGDSYAPTVIYWRGAYRVQSLGDFVETLQRRGVSFA